MPDLIADLIGEVQETLGDLDIIEPESIGIEQIGTINDELTGNIHAIAEVPYESDTVHLGDGRVIEGVFPVFDAIEEVQLPEHLYLASDEVQFAYCNRIIGLEETPEGCVWHHHQETGRMQLVELEEHQAAAHTGGKSLWGGGR